VCSSGVIQIGSGSCGTAGSVGTISGLTIGANVSYGSSSSTVSGSTLTIKLGGGDFFSLTRVSGSWTFTAGGGVTSSGGEHACSAGACSVDRSGAF